LLLDKVGLRLIERVFSLMHGRLAAQDLALLLSEALFRFLDRTLTLEHNSLCFSLLRLQILRVHDRKDLASLHQVAFIGEQLRDATGEFSVDIDRVRFKSAIAGRETRRQSRTRVKPPRPSSETG
jgi:hypothetical protein